jgi:DNA-binding LacI/PurR family transcriptional regulator
LGRFTKGCSNADIARLANVSKSTVSRALNDSPLISQTTKGRIRAVAQQYDFRINALARQLSLKQSRTVAFVTHAYNQEFSVADLFVLEIMGGISTGLRALGYDMLVVHVDPREADWAHAYLDSGRVDGFILLTSARKQVHIRTLLEMDAPFIAWGPAPTGAGYPSVSGDDFEGGKLATEHLVRSGRRQIAFLGGPAEELEVQQRFNGYAAALQVVGRDLDLALRAHGDYTLTSGSAAMQRLLRQAPQLDAVFANSDLMAIAAMEAIRKQGRRVPDDVAVVGYDDLSLAQISYPTLTTIRQDVTLAGQLLAKNLIGYLRTGVVTHTTIPVELVVRQSA